MRRLLAGALLGGVYLAVLGDPRPLDVAVAALVAGGSMTLARAAPASAAHGGPRASARAAAAVRLSGRVAAEVATGSVRVALAVTGIRPPRSPRTIRVEVGSCAERTLVTSGVLLTMSPGSILVATDAERGSLDVHVVDGDDPERVRAQVRDLHALVVRVVGR